MELTPCVNVCELDPRIGFYGTIGQTNTHTHTLAQRKGSSMLETSYVCVCVRERECVMYVCLLGTGRLTEKFMTDEGFFGNFFFLLYKHIQTQNYFL